MNIRKIAKVNDLHTIMDHLPPRCSDARLYRMKNGQVFLYCSSEQIILVPKDFDLKQEREHLEENGFSFLGCRDVNFVSRIEFAPYICTIPRNGIDAINCYPDAKCFTVNGHLVGYSLSKETLIIVYKGPRTASKRQIIRDIMQSEFFEFAPRIQSKVQNPSSEKSNSST